MGSCKIYDTMCPGADDTRRLKRVQRYGEGGVRERWFADDEAADLPTLVKRQRHAGAEDMDSHLAANIARKSNFKWVISECPLS